VTRGGTTVNGDPGGDQPTLWRDVGFYQTSSGGKFVFSVVGSGGIHTTTPLTHHGLHVMDVTGVDTNTPPISRVIMRDRWTSAHTLHVDREGGRLYVCGATGAPSGTTLYIYDISNFDGFNPPPELFPGTGPNAPIFLHAHDAFSRKSRANVASPGRPPTPPLGGYDLLDLSTSPPVVLPGGLQWWAQAGLAHNIWVSEDERLIAVTEEALPGAMQLFQVANPSDTNAAPVHVGVYAAFDGGALFEAPHNVYGIGRTLHVAHYSAGLEIIDATNPGSPVRRGYYDTFPETPGPDGVPPLDVAYGQNCGSVFQGSIRPGYFRGAYDCWPYQDSGYVYVSDSERGLFVLELLAGHFFRTQAATRTPNGATPNIYPSGATPRAGATSFEFRLTGLQANGRYAFKLARDVAEDLPAAPAIGWYVGATTVLTADDVTYPVDASGEVKIPWNLANQPSLTDFYAQVIQMNAQGQPIGSSKLIRFALLP